MDKTFKYVIFNINVLLHCANIYARINYEYT